MVLRLILISHATTTAVRLGAFPRDEPLENEGITAATRIGSARPYPTAAWSGPESRTLQTAAALGLQAEADHDLRDYECGAWAGCALADLHAQSPDALQRWLSDPDFRPPGGESITAIAARTAAWLERAATSEKLHRAVAVTHPAVMRAAMLHALGAPVTSFWRIDVEPLTEVVLSHDGRRWRLQSLMRLQRDV
jgi:broad specificity phosphatase PhoE